MTGGLAQRETLLCPMCRFTFDRPKLRCIITPEGADGALFRLLLLENNLAVPEGGLAVSLCMLLLSVAVSFCRQPAAVCQTT